MKDISGQLRLSATDLANHLGCNHLTQLERCVARGEIERPVRHDPRLDAIIQRGNAHEQAYVAYLREQGLNVVELHDFDGDTARQKTLAAMQAGADVIVQAALSAGRWAGRADILQRVDTPSELGAWSYEVCDTKLARETRGGTVLQLCLYSDLVGRLQGVLPSNMHVVSPGDPFESQRYYVHDYMAYYRFVRGELEAAVETGEAHTTYPEPCAQCDICRWWPQCNARRHDDDHLSLVAGISRLQRREVVNWGIGTLEALAEVPLPLSHKPRRGALASYERVREQARVQLEGRRADAPVHELLDVEPGRGLALLPEPSPGDIFFDIEGDQYVGKHGLEYLFGWALRGDDGEPVYHRQWALDAAQEKAMFEAFIDTVNACRAKHPGMHVYHFAPYEPGALKRLMGRYATREDEIDRLLRAGVFVDLYAVVRQGLRASVERYSIKDLEQFYGYERELELREASTNLRRVEHALELGEEDPVSNAAADAVERYNGDDCYSTLHLRDWLEGLRAGLIAKGTDIPRPEPGEEEPGEKLTARLLAVQALVERLTADVPADPDARSDEQRARWLLAQLLGYHRRENKVVFWEKFRLLALTDEELRDERAAITGLEFVETVGGTDRCPVHRYRYPAQETDIRVGKKLWQSAEGNELGKVDNIDPARRIIDIKKRQDSAGIHPSGAFAFDLIKQRVIEDALMRLAEWVADNGIDAPGPHRAARDLLFGRAPRIAGGAALRREDESVLQSACRLALRLDATVLPIQGPPGAGKTYTGAHMICELVGAGKKVGITAVSHKVIRNLLEEVKKIAVKKGEAVPCIQKVREVSDAVDACIAEVDDNDGVSHALEDSSARVAGGTAWLWSRKEMANVVDVLFVDEAAQMCLANVIAVSQAANSIVLLGDPQQLEQPQQGTHPDGSELSALDHVLGGQDVIPVDRGLFLDETYRLHPSICEFTSELFYEGQLESRPELARQELSGPTPFAGAGLWFVPVEHEANTSSSSEEVDAVAGVVEQLLRDGVTWSNRHGDTKPLTVEDILIVAPYNAQVSELGDRLPGYRIGTVDKFQGQEAPVVIYSMTTSSPEDAPHGMEFLYSLNRLNVATSRARCACILVANPKLFEPECRTPRQIQLANAFCRYREMAASPAIGAS